jgi:hypothetical protein
MIGVGTAFELEACGQTGRRIQPELPDPQPALTLASELDRARSFAHRGCTAGYR